MKAKVIIPFVEEENDLFLKGRLTFFRYIPFGTTFLCDGIAMTKVSLYQAIQCIDNGKDYISHKFLKEKIIFITEDEYRKIEKETNNG